jgi:hypothetical protein
MERVSLRYSNHEKLPSHLDEGAFSWMLFLSQKPAGKMSGEEA